MEYRYVYQRLKSTNDVNGNPRRLLVIYDLDSAGDPIAIIDEGYGGGGVTRLTSESAELGIPTPRVQLSDVEIPPSEYRAWLRNSRALRSVS